MKFSAPYLKWRDGRPRWEPGPKLRQQGAKGQDLKDEFGKWLTLEAAVMRAKELTDAAKGAERERKARRYVHKMPTVLLIWEELIKTPEHKKLREKTRRDYHNKAQVFIKELGDVPAAHIKRKNIKNLWRKLYEERGHSMASGVIAVLRLTLEFGFDEEFIPSNPALKLKLPRPDPRVVIYTPEEVWHLVSTADSMGEYGVADAVVIGLHTAQRQGDVLRMNWSTFDHGNVILKQSKRGEPIHIPQTDVLAQRLEQIKKRRQDNRINYLEVIIDDRTNRPFEASTFRHRLLAVRREANKKMKGIEQKTYADLRDTGLTRLYQAEVSILDIASISGHSVKSVYTIIRHYIALNQGDAARAIDKLNNHIKKHGIKI
jgi:integrase